MLPSIRRDFPNLVDEFFGKDFLSNFFDQQTTGITTPAVNIKETGDSFEIEVAAPGLDKKDFNIDIHNNVLTISSEKEDKTEENEEGKYMRREFSYYKFKRSFTLPDTVKEDKIKAKHKDGVLNITIPKKEEAKEKPPRKIDIS